MEDKLENWRALRTALATANEEECQTMLEAERLGANRPTFLNRIYGRYDTLRRERERRELNTTGAEK